jgi:WD40 repeat protein/serine/threonine protein kinase
MVDGSPMAVKIGEVLAGRYRIERLIGSGGMGVVFAAKHLDLEELRAIKLMHPGEDQNARSLERFLREPRAAARLRSEHVAKIYDVGKLDSGAPFIVMEYLEGIDLRALLARRGVIPAEEAALYIAQACDALAEAHALGIVHRDLKPANLFLTTRANGSPCVKVLDFGISKLQARDGAAAGDDLTQTNDVVGSPNYMSPEQMRATRDVDGRADVWSLGVILYELVTGKKPFPGVRAPEIHAMVLERRPRPPSAWRPDLPPGFDAVILRCLEKDRANRMPSAASLMTALLPFIDEGGGAASGRASRPSLNPLSAPLSAPLTAPPALAPAERRSSLPDEPPAPARASVKGADRASEIPPEKRLAKANLRGQDLSGRDLRSADMTGADITGASLAGADMARASLQRARLVRANLAGAKLERADLRDANLSRARLFGADLSGAALEGAIMRRAKLVGAKVDQGALEGCDIFGAALPDTAAITPVIAAASPCETLAFSRSGELVISGHKDGSVRLIDAMQRLSLRVLPGSAEVWSVAWSPNDARIAGASRDGAIRLWDAATGAEERVLVASRGAVLSVAWSPDGKTLASGHWDGSVLLWDPETGAQRRALEGHKGSVKSVAWSPDGLLLATGALDKTVRLWNASTGSQVSAMGGQPSELRSIAFNPTGSMVLAGALLDRTIRIWETATGAERSVLATREGSVGNVAWSRDGRALASGCLDNAVRIWSAASGAVWRVLVGHTGEVRSVAWSPDGRVIATGSLDSTVRFWDAKTGAELGCIRGHASSASNIAFSPDGRALAQVCEDKAIRLWDVGSGSGARVLPPAPSAPPTPPAPPAPPATGSLAFSPDGRAIASASGRGLVFLWDAMSSEEPRALSAEGARIGRVCFHPDGSELAGGSLEGAIWLWSLKAEKRASGGAIARSLATAPAPIHCLTWSPDGAFIAGGCADGALRLWDAASGAEQRVHAGRSGSTWAVAWSPDSRSLAVGSADRSVRLMDVVTGAARRVFAGHSGEVRSVAFSPDGASLAVGSDDHRISLWDASTGGRRLLSGHTGPVHHVAWSSAGVLASSSSDGTARLWDAASGRCLAVLLSLPRGWAAFSPDGRYRLGGDIAGSFWHSAGLCRFEPGELDPYLAAPLSVPEGAPLLPGAWGGAPPARADSQAQAEAEALAKRDSAEDALFIDSRPLLGGEGTIWRVPYARYGSVPALLNHIYRSIHGGGHIPPFTYGKRWVLRDATSGRVLTPADIMLKDDGRRVESRSLLEIGVPPGTSLEVIAP